MRLCSYNIQYGVGLDGVLDLARTASDIGSADVICLQEVEQLFAETGSTDQVAELAEFFPQHHWVYTPGVSLDADDVDATGKVVHRRRTFGNMLLSKSRIRSVRGHLLPKHHLIEQFSLQRVALDAIIEAPSGPLRIVTTHLAHASPHERADQIGHLLGLINNNDGGAWSGRAAPDHWTESGPPPEHPTRTLLCGDLNLVPDSPEYDLIVGPADLGHGRLATAGHLIDVWVAVGAGPHDQPTCVEDARGHRPERRVRLDYLFATPDLAPAVTSMRVGTDAEGSDHQPIFAELDL